MKDKPKCNSRQLILLQHGENLWNKENRFRGWTDVDLSDYGREEARIADRILKEYGVTFGLCVHVCFEACNSDSVDCTRRNGSDVGLRPPGLATERTALRCFAMA